jgi:hypothetical protein
MKPGGIGRFGVGLVAGASLAIATGCASTAGWGPTPPVTPTSATAGHGAPRFAETSGLGAFTWRETEVPPWVRVQDCAIDLDSEPLRLPRR